MTTTVATIGDIDQVLESLLNSLSPAQTRRAMREIANYLRSRNLHRITAQQNADGSRYAPRKNPSSKRNMLLGFRRHLKTKVDIEKLQVGIFGNAARLANVHHGGETEKGIRYPSRELVTLAQEDKERIRDIILSLLTG